LRALITGGAGFIGSHLAEALLADGHEVAIIDDLSTGRFQNIEHLTKNPRFHFAIESVTNPVVMDRLVSQSDVVYHLAAAVGVQLIVKSPVHTLETNILGTQAVLSAASRYRCKVFLASTSEIYGKSEKVPFREDDDRVLGPTSRSRWSYSTSKAVDEFLAFAYWKERGLPTVIGRLFNTIGPRQTGRYGMVVPRFVGQALRGEPITVYGDGQQTRCFCDVQDVVRAIRMLMEHPGAVGEAFNIGSTDEITILALAQKVLHLVEAFKDSTGRATPGVKPAGIVFIPYEKAYEAGFEDMQRRVPDISKLRRLTGWEPQVPLEDTLRNIIQEYQNRP